MASLNAGRLDINGSELFGRGAKQGVLDLLRESGGGTLLLNGMHEMPPALLPRLITLLKTGDYRSRNPGSIGSRPSPPSPSASTDAADNFSASSGIRIIEQSERLPSSGSSRSLAIHGVRIIMTSERPLGPENEALAEIVKIPPLRVRPSDVKDYALYFLNAHSPHHRHHQDATISISTSSEAVGGGGSSSLKPSPSSSSSSSSSKGHESGPKKLTLTKEALKRLEAYHWPGNVVELEGAVMRAATISEGQGGQLQESLFWSAAQSKDRLRFNLLTAYPLLKQILRSDFWPDAINFKFTAFVYPLVLAVLFFGPQDRDHNPMLNVFWDMWWPLVFISFLFLGRIWCSVCPFMIYGELVQRWRESNGVKLLKWPREQLEKYGPWFLFGLFAAILVWEEVWDLPHSAALSGW